MSAQPTLTDGVVTLRPWQDEDIDEAVAGHDEVIAHWYGFPAVRPTREQHASAVERWRKGYEEGKVANFVISCGSRIVGSCEVRALDPALGELSWTLYAGHRGRGFATRSVRLLTDWAMTGIELGGLGLSRVEAKVEPGNEASLRVATRAGLRREGLRRVVPGSGDRAETTEYVILARLSSDPPLTEPASFRALLNSFLPRKRAISQMLIRDAPGPQARVLLCQLTYKQDWDLPGGVVEVGESPQLAVAREVEEELGLVLAAGPLLLTDWLPPWGGWDDALCLVFDGGVRDAALTQRLALQEREIRAAEFCTLPDIESRCADFTARRIRSALVNLADESDTGPAYTESGR